MDPSTPTSNQKSPSSSSSSIPSGIKKPSGIPSASGISRLQPPSTVKKSGIPPPTTTAAAAAATTTTTPSVARATTPTNLPATSSSTGRATTPTNLPSSTSTPQQLSSTKLPTSSSSTSLVKPSSSSSTLTPTASTDGAGLPQLVRKNSIGSSQQQQQQQPQDNDDKEKIQLRGQIKDLNEKLETLKLKRAEDREKLREFDKLKLLNQQLQDFKEKAQEKMSDLNKELQICKQEMKQYKDQYEAYKEEMSNHEERIEHMTVEKELAEELSEQYKYEITQLTDKLDELTLELDVLKDEIEQNGTEGAAASFQTKQQDKERERLSAALIALRDKSHQDKNEINTLKKQLEDVSTKSVQLQKENEKLKSDTQANLVQINELNDQVTATLGSVQMIESLTEENLDLEAKILKLEEQIAELEDLNEVNDQILESVKEEEKEVRQQLDMTEMRVREFEKENESLKYRIADHEKTIIKFRDLVQQQRNEKDEMTRRLQIRIDELQAKLTQFTSSSSTLVISPGNFDFKQKLVESKNFAKLIENELNKIEILNLKKYNAYLLTFMSDQFLKRSGDHECILTLLFFKRITNKSDLILNQVKEKYAHLIEQKTSTVTTNGDHPEFVFEISMILMHLKLICNRYDFILNTCSPKVFLNMGSMLFDFNSHEKVIDLMTDLLQKDQLDENRKNLELAEKMCIHLQTIYKNHLTDEKYDEIQFLEDLVNLGTFGCESITVYLQNINSLVQVKDDQTEIMQLLRELHLNNEELKVYLKKTLKRIPKQDNKSKIILNLPNELQKQLEQSINQFYMVSKTLKELNYLAINSQTIYGSSSNTNEQSISTTENNSLSAKKLEDLAYQACDKVYLVDDNGPYDNLRNSIQELNQTFMQIITGLDTGEYEKVLTDEEYKLRKYMINSPLVLAAEQFKQALIETESIRYKLETKEDEIKEIKRNLKVKLDELSEYKLRVNLNENKSETALREAEENRKKLVQSIDELKASFIKKEEEHIKTIDAMQQELDSHENEIRELKKKVPKKIANDTSPASQSPFSPQQQQSNFKTNNIMTSFNDSPYLIQEIKVAKTLNKLLEKNNSNMKKQLTETMLNNLVPLPKVALIKQQINDSDNKIETISKLNKQSNDLMKEIYESLANVKVHELKSINNSEKYTNGKENKEKFHYNMICQTANQLQKKIFELKAQLNQSNTIKCTKNEGKKKIVGEIILPCQSAKSKTIDLSVNYDELRELLKFI